MRWSEVRYEMSRARNKHAGRCVSRNTRIRVSQTSPSEWDADDAVYALCLHGTEIIRWYPNGDTDVSLSGWNTITTKRRIRDYTGFSLTRDGENIWCIGASRHAIRGYWPGDEYTWFRRSGVGTLCIPGTNLPTPRLLCVGRVGGKVPKRRNPLYNPISGDVFRIGADKFKVVHLHSSRKHVSSYLGDLPVDRRYAVVGIDTEPYEEGGMNALARIGNGWEPVKRFLWRQDG